MLFAKWRAFCIGLNVLTGLTFFIVLSVLGTLSVTLDFSMVDADSSVSFIDQVVQ